MSENYPKEQKLIDDVFVSFDKKLNFYESYFEEYNHKDFRDRDINPQDYIDRNIKINTYIDKFVNTRNAEFGLIFGRLKYNDGRDVHIGKISLNNDDNRPILVDWRAPIAEDFYTATYYDPKNLQSRFNIKVKDRKIEFIEEEKFTSSDKADDKSEDKADDSANNNSNNISSDGALMSALSASKDAYMHDIVSTIQKEQYEIIRSDEDFLIVQGGPGTGKTAIVLHRLAYLLYNNREFYEKSDILLIGPSKQFLKYISGVLPALGESNMINITLSDIIYRSAYYNFISDDEFEKAKLYNYKKIFGNIDWYDFIQKAVVTFEKNINKNVKINLGITNDDNELIELFFPKSLIYNTQNSLKNFTGTYLEKRAKYTEKIVFHLMKQVTNQHIDFDIIKKQYKYNFNIDLKLLYNTIKSNPLIKTIINHTMPKLDAYNFMFNLLNSTDYLAKNATFLSHNDIDDINELMGEYSKNSNNIPLFLTSLLRSCQNIIGVTDLEFKNIDTKEMPDVDINEQAVETAKELLRRSGYGEYAFEDSELIDRFQNYNNKVYENSNPYDSKYGHIVVDEAQEYTPLDWFIINHMSLNNSYTIVGDIAQNSSNSNDLGWSDLLEPIKDSVEDSYKELTINYRNTSQMWDIALDCINKYNLKNTTKHTPRSAPGSLEYINSFDNINLKDLTIIADLDSIKSLKNDLKNDSIVYVTPTEAKGLEWNNVLVYEPDKILSIYSPHDLFVTLTRATNKLYIFKPQ
ncbi:MAG: AAA family ATPase [Bifidobacteriaceae bacterium]|jgi:DNA helicase IV|nr:AAA family ATPase [Bifidobacteriaceae bacterium]